MQNPVGNQPSGLTYLDHYEIKTVKLNAFLVAAWP